jgi:tight adherence protein B
MAAIDFGDPNTMLLAGAFGCTLALTLLIGTIFAGGAGNDRRFKRRVARVQNRRMRGSSDGTVSPTRQLAPQESATPGLDKLVNRWLPRQEVLRDRLARTGKQITIGHYCMWMAITGLVTAALAMGLADLGFVPTLFVGLLAGVWLPHMAVSRMVTRRILKFNALFPDAIDLIVRAIKSGLPIAEAVVTVGQEVSGPVGEEFRKIEGGLRVGRNLEDILWDVAGRLDTAEFRFFVISLSVQRQTGGNLAETLDNLSDILRRRRQMLLKIRALTSEARASAMILGSLPFVVLGLILLISPSYITPLFTDSRGLVMVGIACGMLLTGIGIMSKMIKFEI